MRLLTPAVGLCVLGIALAGCGAAESAPTETVLSMPASPAPTSDASVAPDPQAAPAEGQPSGAAGPSEHCVIVAGGVTTAMLAPLSLRSETDRDELVALRQQILDLREKVPADLHDDFTTLADSVEASPKGSGHFDESSFRKAMVPVQDWLGQHCNRT